MHPYVYLFFSLIIISIGDYFAKKWSLTNDKVCLVSCLVCYVSCSMCWLPLLKLKGLIIATTVWSVLIIISSILVAVCMGEPLTGFKLVGILLGIASVVMLNLN